MKENPFLAVMRKHSNDELQDILNVRREEYVADAIAAVEEVLKERGVNYEKKPDEVFIEDEIMTIDKIKADNGKRLLGHIIDMAFLIFFTIIILKLTVIVERITMSNFEVNFICFAFYLIDRILKNKQYSRSLVKKIYICDVNKRSFFDTKKNTYG